MKLFVVLLLTLSSNTGAFLPSPLLQQRLPSSSSCATSNTKSPSPIQWKLSMSAVDQSSSSASAETVEQQSILADLRDVAMKLHTREQAPREGQAPAPQKPATPFVPTQSDYLQFLVDSLHVYQALEDVVASSPELASRFVNTGLERTKELETDIEWMMKKYGLTRPEVGAAGRKYAEQLKNMVTVENGSSKGVPEFICHYYNFYFAHLAGGRMIGKQMSNLLIDGETLEFYKWGENVNSLKTQVKDSIEDIAGTWSQEERQQCIDATASAFQGGGAINGYLFGGSPH